MKENKKLLPSIILAFGLIISSLIYAYSTRYIVNLNHGFIRIDRWTGTIENLK